MYMNHGKSGINAALGAEKYKLFLETGGNDNDES